MLHLFCHSSWELKALSGECMLMKFKLIFARSNVKAKIRPGVEACWFLASYSLALILLVSAKAEELEAVSSISAAWFEAYMLTQHAT